VHEGTDAVAAASLGIPAAARTDRDRELVRLVATRVNAIASFTSIAGPGDIERH